MAISFIAYTENSSGWGNSIAVDKPSSQAADLCVVCLQKQGSETVTVPSGFNGIDSQYPRTSGSGYYIQFFSKTLDGTEGSTLTFSWTTEGDSIKTLAMVFRGAAAHDVINKQYMSGGQDIVFPGVTTSQADELLLAVFVAANAANAWDSPLTEICDSGTSALWTAGWGEQAASGPTGDKTATSDWPSAFVAYLLAFLPAGPTVDPGSVWIRVDL